MGKTNAYEKKVTKQCSHHIVRSILITIFALNWKIFRLLKLQNLVARVKSGNGLYTISFVLYILASSLLFSPIQGPGFDKLSPEDLNANIFSICLSMIIFRNAFTVIRDSGVSISLIDMLFVLLYNMSLKPNYYLIYLICVHV